MVGRGRGHCLVVVWAASWSSRKPGQASSRGDRNRNELHAGPSARNNGWVGRQHEASAWAAPMSSPGGTLASGETPSPPQGSAASTAVGGQARHANRAVICRAECDIPPRSRPHVRCGRTGYGGCRRSRERRTGLMQDLVTAFLRTPQPCGRGSPSGPRASVRQRITIVWSLIKGDP